MKRCSLNFPTQMLHCVARHSKTSLRLNETLWTTLKPIHVIHSKKKKKTNWTNMIHMIHLLCLLNLSVDAHHISQNLKFTKSKGLPVSHKTVFYVRLNLLSSIWPNEHSTYNITSFNFISFADEVTTHFFCFIFIFVQIVQIGHFIYYCIVFSSRKFLDCVRENCMTCDLCCRQYQNVD